MKFFNPRKKAIFWILISFIFLILFVNSDDEFFKGNIFENLVALFGASLISGFVGFMVLFFVDGFISLFSSSEASSNEDKIKIPADDREKFKKEIDQFSLKLKKKLSKISKSFKKDQEYSDKEVKDIISKNLEGINEKGMCPDYMGGFHFKFKEFNDFHFSLNFMNMFNFGCYGRDDFHGIAIEYFSKINKYRIKLDTKEENISQENAKKRLLKPEAIEVIEKVSSKPFFKTSTTSKSKLLYEKMVITEHFMDSKTFDKIY
jgi:hypothetical protein